MSEPQVVWAVEVGEYEQSMVMAAFTSESLAEEYAEREGGYAHAVPLYSRPVAKVPYYQAGADVLPDGTVKRWDREHESDEPGMQPVEPNTDLHKVYGPWDGHSQGHCGYHVCVFGSDRVKTEEAREHWVGEYLKLCNGTCPKCGRTGPYKTGFWHDPEEPQPQQVILEPDPDDERSFGKGTMDVNVVRANGAEETHSIPVSLIETDEGIMRVNDSGEEKRAVPSYDFNVIPNLEVGDKIEVGNGLTITMKPKKAIES